MATKTKMTVQEFNQNFKIEVITKASMPAKLDTNPEHTHDELEYGALEEALENLSYNVRDLRTNDYVNFDDTTDTFAIDAILHHFNIEIVDEKQEQDGV